MTTRRTFIIRLIAASGLAWAVSSGTALAQGAKPVRIGFSIAKTGIFTAAAPSQLNAYELWREQVNARGGLEIGKEKRPVEFVMYDDQSNPAQAAKIYEKLITDDKVELLPSVQEAFRNVSPRLAARRTSLNTITPSRPPRRQIAVEYEYVHPRSTI